MTDSCDLLLPHVNSFPFFHWPTYVGSIQNQVHKTNRGFCVLTLAVSALAAARVRDQASLSPLDSRLAAIPAEAWSRACRANLPMGHSTSKDYADSFNYMRTFALLAILSVQNADIPNFQMYLGRYLTLSAVWSFHQESRWKPDLNDLERDERRSLVSRSILRIRFRWLD